VDLAFADGRALFGHTRLAILDTFARGAQPSIAKDGSSAFMTNGEIYNFRQLRARLESRGEQFVSTGDTEVAHRWLDLEGPRGVEGLEGMFALAHWSEREGRLLLARDRLGVKPLYYARMPGGLAFASQPKALLALDPISARLDPDALSDYLAYGYVPFDRCIFAGIHKVPPAHVLQYEPDGGRVSLRHYWKLARHEVLDDAEVLRERIGQAVSSHLVSDVPVGAFLSGGLDSTTVAAVASRELSGLSTFAVSYVDGDSSDILHARIASRALGTRHREEILHMDGVAHALARCAEVYDEPLYDPRALAMLDLARMTRRTVKVALSGDGGDEVFGGYGWHETMLRYQSRRESWKSLDGALSFLWRGVVGPLSSRPVAGRLAGSARLLARRFCRPGFRGAWFFRERSRGASWGALQTMPRASSASSTGPTFRTCIGCCGWTSTLLPDNGLALVDRSTMAVGLEARVPCSTGASSSTPAAALAASPAGRDEGGLSGGGRAVDSASIHSRPNRVSRLHSNDGSAGRGASTLSQCSSAASSPPTRDRRESLRARPGRPAPVPSCGSC
jgi:asparagine synthase (glutamine-hydrolysing)